MASSIVNKAVAWALARRPVRAYLLYSGSRGPMLADSVTYRTLFSVFAAVLLGFSVAALWLAGNPDAWNALIAAVNSAIPGLVGTDGESGLIDVSDVQAPAGLTIAGVVSAAGLVGAAIGAIGSLRSALRTIAGRVHDDVMFVWMMLRNLALAVGMGVGLVAAAAVTFAATAGLGLVTNALGLPADDGGAAFVAWLVSAIVVFALDSAVVAALFAVLSGVHARARTLWAGAALGGLGLTVLQQLSGLFIGGASSNPLLASFASLIALLLWLNLSSQVILIAGAYIVTGVEEDADRVHARHGASTMAQFQVRQAERAVAATTEALQATRAVEEKERAGS
jgi:membrane protein